MKELEVQCLILVYRLVNFRPPLLLANTLFVLLPVLGFLVLLDVDHTIAWTARELPTLIWRHKAMKFGQLGGLN